MAVSGSCWALLWYILLGMRYDMIWEGVCTGEMGVYMAALLARWGGTIRYDMIRQTAFALDNHGAGA